MFLLLNLSDYYNNDGFVSKSSVEGDFDFGGWCYIAETFKFGQVEIGGVKFRLADSPDIPNNISCSGQEIRLEKPVSGYKYMLILESGANGSWIEKLKLKYKEGIEEVEVHFTDWCQQPDVGEVPVFVSEMRYNSLTGETHAILNSIFLTSVPLNPKKTLVSVILPDNKNVHIFAITLVKELPKKLKKALSEAPELVAPWAKEKWIDTKEPPSEAFTSFQTNASYNPGIDIKTDAVLVYGACKRKVRGWQNKGYRIWSMYNSIWDNIHTPVFKKHPEIIQTLKDGKPYQLMADRYWAVPSPIWADYIWKRVERGLEAGVEAVVLEEPEYSYSAGYSGYFKKAWEEFYGEPWRPPHSSPTAAFKAGRLIGHLLSEFYRDVFKKVKEKVPGVKTYIATHSIFHYVTMFVAPFSKFIDNPYCDGIIGQVWTGTAKYPFVLRGKRASYIFQRAYLEYSFFAGFKRAWKEKEMWFLTDPVEDDPDYTWDFYKKSYIKTMIASLLFPEVYRYEVTPWPERVFGKGVKYSGQKAPQNYMSLLLLIWDMERRLHKYKNDVEWISGEPTFLAPISETSAYQKVGGYTFDFDPFLYMTVPLLQWGNGVYAFPMEGIAKDPASISDFKVMLLDYSISKPDDPKINRNIADWVKSGGTLVIFGGEDRFCKIEGTWWSKEGFDSPAEALLSELGVKVLKKKAAYPGGGKVIYNSVETLGRSVHDLSNLGPYSFDLSHLLPADAITVEFTDATPKDGWGPTIKKIIFETDLERIEFIPGQPEEKSYLWAFSPPGGVGSDFRYVDGSGLLTYAFPVKGARWAKLTVVIGNDFVISVGKTWLLIPRRRGILKYAPRILKPPYTIYWAEDVEVLGKSIDGVPMVWRKKVGKGWVWHVAFSPANFSSPEGEEFYRRLLKKIYPKLCERGFVALRRGPYIIGYTLDKSFELKGKYINMLDPELPLVEDPSIPRGKPFLFLATKRVKENGVVVATGRWRQVEKQDSLEIILAAPRERVCVCLVKVPYDDFDVKVLNAEGKECEFEILKTGKFVRIFTESAFNGKRIRIIFGCKRKLPALSKFKLSGRVEYLGFARELKLALKPGFRDVYLIDKWLNKGKPFLYIDSGLCSDSSHAWADGKSFGVWKFKTSGFTKLVLAIRLGNNFTLSVGRGGSWIEVLNSQEFYGKDYHNMENFGWYFVDLSGLLPSDYIYVKVGDASPSNGWGGSVYAIRIFIPPLLEEGEFLYVGWKGYSPPRILFGKTPVIFSYASDSFSVFSNFEELNYVGKVRVRKSGYLKIGNLRLPVYVVSEEEKLRSFKSMVSRGVSIQIANPISQVIAETAYNLLTSSVEKPVEYTLPVGVVPICGFDAAGSGEEKDFIFEDHGSQRGGVGRFTDGNSYIVYRFPIPLKAKELFLKIKIGNDFRIFVSTDAQNWKKVADSKKMYGKSFKALENYKDYVFRLDVKLPAPYIYLKITDATSNDGWGANFSSIKIYGRLP